MKALIELFGSEFWRTALVALAHSVWIGAAAASVLWLALRRMSADRAELRYGISVGALCSVFLVAVLVWAIIAYEPPKPGVGIELRGRAEAERTSAGSSSATSSALTSGSAGIENGSAGQAGNRGSRYLASEQQKAAPAGARQAADSSARSPIAWASVLAAAWSAGAVLMLLRALWSLAGAERLRRRARPVDGDFAIDLSEQMRDRLGIVRRVTIGVADVAGPAVVGLLRPMVLLPVSMLSDLPPDVLKAVLAHELAHIRRHDLLVNVLQMILEALFFFNPAVWWLSRQVRVEREACCDAIAARLVGRPTDYARALTHYVEERVGLGDTPHAAPAFSHGGKNGLLDRVRRLVAPDYRPAFRLPWYGAVSLLLLSMLALFLLKTGVGELVTAAADILTPEERMERVEQLRKEYKVAPTGGLPTQAEEYTLLLTGCVLDPEGSPVPKANLMIHVEQTRSTSSIGYGTDGEGNFSLKAPHGIVWVLAHAEGYAPTFVGPFFPEPDEGKLNLTLRLSDGFRSSIRVRNSAGDPIAGVELTGGYPLNGSYSHTVKITTNASGIASIDHASTRSLSLRTKADGYQPQSIEGLKLTPERPLEITLKRAPLTSGVVLDAVTREPVPGAEICMVAARGAEYSSGYDAERAPVAAKSDGQGRFSLDSLNGASQYFFLVRAEGYRPEKLLNVHPGSENLMVEMEPPLYVEGKVLGPEFAELRDDKYIVEWFLAFQYKISADSTYHTIGKSGVAPLEVKDGEGRFRIDDLWEDTLTLRAGGESRRIELKKSRNDIVFDLMPTAEASPPKRPVVIRFDAPEGAPPPQGKIRVMYIDPRKRERNAYTEYEYYSIEDGAIRLEVMTPTKLGYNNDGVVAYWFAEKLGIELPEGEEPFGSL